MLSRGKDDQIAFFSDFCVLVAPSLASLAVPPALVLPATRPTDRATAVNKVDCRSIYYLTIRLLLQRQRQRLKLIDLK